MTATAVRPVELQGASVRRSRRPAVRHLWLVPGFGFAILANAEAAGLGVGIGLVILFGVLPHLPAWLGLLWRDEKGRLGARTTALFNVMHHPGVPVVLISLAAAGLLPPVALVAGLAWLGHVVADWGLGDGRRSADGTRSAPSFPARLVSRAAPRPDSIERG